MMTLLFYFVISLPELVVIVIISQEAHQQVQQASQLTLTKITNKIERGAPGTQVAETRALLSALSDSQRTCWCDQHGLPRSFCAPNQTA